MQSFASHIQHVLNTNGVEENHTLIVAVSGGADSMALLHGCSLLHGRCVAAHVNYGLRGADSNDDEALVRSYCSSHNIPLEALVVEEERWEKHPGSTQEAARAIRYAWFEELRLKHSALFILTAHHANDQTETMLYQFIRGGAGRSVYGMALRSENTLRPLLALTRQAVIDYVEEQSVPWRHDRSNDTTQYARNRVRHEILPLIEALNPSIHEGIQQRSAWMHQEQAMVEWAAKTYLKNNLSSANGVETLSIPSLLETGFMEVLLWKWLYPVGFTSPTVVQISSSIANAYDEAIWFSSATHDVCIQGNTIACILTAAPANELIASLPWSNAFIRIDHCTPEEVEFTTDSTRQYLDADKLTLPFLLRSWQPGDRMLALGAPGAQKVSDILTHSKTPSWKKKCALILSCDEDIACILQTRISENFKKTASTQRCVRIQFS
jgi:tRNA(Ile)-lysidine synthase